MEEIYGSAIDKRGLAEELMEIAKMLLDDNGQPAEVMDCGCPLSNEYLSGHTLD